MSSQFCIMNITPNYGSFERKQKTRLDDIDMMIGIKADGCTYIETNVNDVKIYFP